MKRLLTFIAAFAICITALSQNYDVYLCIGQSNMAGRGILEPQDMEPVEGVYLLGPEDKPFPATGNANIYSTIRKRAGMQGYNLSIPFAQKMYRETGRPVLLVVNARGGTMLDQWVKDAPCYTFNAKEGDDSEKIGQPIPQFYAEAVRRAKAAMQYGTLKGILWHQGCGDRYQKLRETYMERISKMVADLRSDLGVGEEVRFVLGEVFHGGIGAPVNPTLAQVSCYVPNSFCASADGCTANKDNLHFSRAGLVRLGERYAEAMLGEQQPYCYVKARNPFLHQWIMYPSVTLAQLPQKPKPDKLNEWGSLADGPQFESTGYFHTAKHEGRWIMVDPVGCMHIDAGVCHIIKGHGDVHVAAFNDKYADDLKWFRDARTVMFKAGFNGSGAFSSAQYIQEWNRANPKKPFTYCVDLSVMAHYMRAARSRYKDYGFKFGIPVFDPEFIDFARVWVKEKTAAIVDDPALVGYFSDNELRFCLESLEENLNLPESFAGRKAAHDWLAAKGVQPDGITDELRMEFAAYVAERYYSIMRSVIKSIDKNHLYLGSRLHGDIKFYEGVVRAAGKYCDVVTYNYYSDWCVRPEEIALWNEWSCKPFMITEFYTKGDDVGLANTRGAGWKVPTQKDRADFYQNFVIQLLSSGSCVGWHWFKYQDNDPTDKTMDPTNTDSNKGVVDNSYEPYKELLDAMKAINIRRYSLMK